MRNFQDNTFEHKHMERFFKPALTLWARRATGSGTGGCRGWSLLPCTHVGRACKKQPSFEENWMDVLKILVSTLNSPELLRYNRLKLCFLLFFNVNFSKCSRAEWVKSKHCFGPKVKKGSFSKVSPHFQMK